MDEIRTRVFFDVSTGFEPLNAGETHREAVRNLALDLVQIPVLVMTIGVLVLPAASKHQKAVVAAEKRQLVCWQKT